MKQSFHFVNETRLVYGQILTSENFMTTHFASMATAEIKYLCFQITFQMNKVFVRMIVMYVLNTVYTLNAPRDRLLEYF